MNGNISIVIGSWGSYNECNERALGSKWLDLSDYSDWDEIVEELKKEGFELDGIDEELFIQDIEGINDSSVNWDYVNPETLFNTLVYAVTHEYTDFGECYDFLYISDYEEDWEEMLYPQGNMYYVFTYPYPTSDTSLTNGTITYLFARQRTKRTIEAVLITILRLKIWN